MKGKTHYGSDEYYITESGGEEDNQYTACGHYSEYGTNCTKNWEAVTCKKCLTHKKELKQDE